MTFETLVGGSAPSGIERWIVIAAGEPEEIRLDASLLAISAATGHRYCWFSLNGKLVSVPH